MGHMVFGRPVFWCANGSQFGRGQLLEEGMLTDLSLTQKIK